MNAALQGAIVKGFLFRTFFDCLDLCCLNLLVKAMKYN